MSRAQVLNLENEKSNVLYVGLNDSHNPTNTTRQLDIHTDSAFLLGLANAQTAFVGLPASHKV